MQKDYRVYAVDGAELGYDTELFFVKVTIKYLDYNRTTQSPVLVRHF